MSFRHSAPITLCLKKYFNISLDIELDLWYNYSMLKILYIIFITIFMLSPATAISSSSSIRFTEHGCNVVAEALGLAAAQRDIGFKLEQHQKELKEAVKLEKPVLDLILQEVVKVHGVYKSLSPEKVYTIFLENCYKYNGDIEKLTDKRI